MPENYKYVWRCPRCSNHFANITEYKGMLKEEKKCPKCKSLNELVMDNGELRIHCRVFDPKTKRYLEEYCD